MTTFCDSECKLFYALSNNLTKLVYFEETSDIGSAIEREKQLKNWHRDWKIKLLSFAKVMEHYPFYYIPLTFILSPAYGGEDKGEGV